jgi:hypothetical protein
MTPAPGRALQMAAIVGLASPGCRVMFGAPPKSLVSWIWISITLVHNGFLHHICAAHRRCGFSDGFIELHAARRSSPLRLAARQSAEFLLGER